MAGCCERDDEPSDSVKCGEFFDKLRDFWLLKKDTAVAI